ncbi:hypothetical protein, partial [Streptomyces sp. ERV7]|uniref:hypothetical protein n=1 Tax=Streptomyces sp. ERV7 TaxID=1322334 RepID=UPI001F3DBE63
MTLHGVQCPLGDPPQVRDEFRRAEQGVVKAQSSDAVGEVPGGVNGRAQEAVVLVELTSASSRRESEGQIQTERVAPDDDGCSVPAWGPRFSALGAAVAAGADLWGAQRGEGMARGASSAGRADPVAAVSTGELQRDRAEALAFAASASHAALGTIRIKVVLTA